ncbi:hypothetical protein C5167_028631 [Papaver somniferum]|nr:hypothetical protein C5167_028631 [Papaver somniferum]
MKTPSDFPFKIEDKPGNQTVTLTRKYRGADIKVIVHMPADHSSTVEEMGDELDSENHDQHKDSIVSDPQSSIRLVVTGTNSLGTTLEYGVIAYPDDFLIDSFCVKYANAPDEENIYYKGPDYAKLDKNLRKEYHRRLKILGIIPSTANFLHKYMANRDMCLSDSSNSPPPPRTTTSTDQSTPKSVKTRHILFSDEGLAVHRVIGKIKYTDKEDIHLSVLMISGTVEKNPKDFVWIPYPYTRSSEKLMWIEVPSKGFDTPRSEVERIHHDDDSKLFLDGEAWGANPYRCLPPKAFGTPPVINEEMDKILYPDLKHATDPKKAWKECGAALKAHNDEMEKIKYPNGRINISDSDLEYYQVYCM